MKHGFFSVAAATPMVRVADCEHNKKEILSLIEEAKEKEAAILVFPALSVTSATCGDLYLHAPLIEGAENALKEILDATRDTDMLIALGLPARVNGKIYNSAAICHKGRILSLVPKASLSPQERRTFAPAPKENFYALFCGQEVLFGRNTIITCENIPALSLAAEIGEDSLSPFSYTNSLAAQVASVILSLNSDCETAVSEERRRELCRSRSALLSCGYVYANCGRGESTTDCVFSGHSLIAENGRIIKENAPFSSSSLTVSEIDISYLSFVRSKNYALDAETFSADTVFFSLEEKETVLTRNIKKAPFLPDDMSSLDCRLEKILKIQAEGLATRIKAAYAKDAVIAISGGLDSTLALAVAVRAFDIAGITRENIRAVTMPCFGTTERTKSNAIDLCRAYGVDIKEISIKAAVTQHFKDIGHDPEIKNVTYENAQARERTQVLFDMANETGGLVIGTGDLSELALGWATYNGDHMSSYGVNASIPKTLVRHLVSYEAKRAGEGSELHRVLTDILDTPVSPELLPAENGNIAQKTEDIVGPYDLHDFFLYHTVHNGFSPDKTERLASIALGDEFSTEEIRKWLDTFTRRFFSQQFKRTCLPDGPMVGSLTLSPRGGIMMPSDASANEWKKRLE